MGRHGIRERGRPRTPLGLLTGEHIVAVARADADRRGTAHLKVVDGVVHLPWRGQRNMLQPVGQKRLVDDHDRAVAIRQLDCVRVRDAGATGRTFGLSHAS